MSDPVDLLIGGRKAAYRRSETMIAVAPSPMTRFALESFEPGAGAPSNLRGSLAGLDIVQLAPGAPDRFSSVARGTVGTRGVYHTSDDGVPFVPTGRITIGLLDQLGADTETFLDQQGLVLERTSAPDRYVAHANGDVVEICARLQQDPAVTLAEPDFATLWEPYGLISVDDPRFADQWHLRNTGFHRNTSHKFRAGADARVVDAWNALGNLGSPDVVVGIVDDGFDLSHPDLLDKSQSALDLDSGTDDVRPRYFGRGRGDWHGTGCAGLIAGHPDGGEIVGIAPMSPIIPIRIGPEFDGAKLVRIFRYLADNGAWLVNCSWGPTAQDYVLSTEVHEAISYCVTQGRGGLGTPVLFAAGNRGSPVSEGAFHNGLAAHPDVICVSSSTSSDTFARGSNHGREVLVCAPSSGNGWRLTTSDVTGSVTDANGQSFTRGYALGAYTDNFTGTSGACAVATGVCALVLSAVPQLTARQLRQVMTSSARRIEDAEDDYDASGHSVRFGHGCVDAATAIAHARKLVAVA